jgi:hypothetical protein
MTSLMNSAGDRMPPAPSSEIDSALSSSGALLLALADEVDEVLDGLGLQGVSVRRRERRLLDLGLELVHTVLDLVDGLLRLGVCLAGLLGLRLDLVDARLELALPGRVEVLDEPS